MERKRSSRRYAVREKTCFAKFKDYFRQFIAFMFSNVGIIGLVVGYTIAGAFVFQAIEGQAGTKGNIAMLRERNLTVERLWNLTSTRHVFEDSEVQWTNSVATELLAYQREVVHQVRNGFDGSDNVETSHQWSLTAAFLYSLTVITTIGYGNVTPQTEWGKVATIFYAIAGMPLFLLYLSNIGDILARSFKWLYARCCLCKCCPKKRKKPQLGVVSALKTITPTTLEAYPRGGQKLQRGNSDRGPANRQALGMNRLQGSLSMEDGVNIERGRRELDGFGRRFKVGYGRNDEDVDDEFNERNYGLHGKDFEDDIYSSQDIHLNRANSKMMTNVYERADGNFNRASSTGDVRASEYETGPPGRSQRNAGQQGYDPGQRYADMNPRPQRGSAAETSRRGLTRQHSVFEPNDRDLTNGGARRERGGSERLRRDMEKESGMTKAELVLGMNDLGLEYLDLPKKKGPLQRVFGKTEVRPNRTEDLGMTQLGMKDTSRFEGFLQRGSGGSERAFYTPDMNVGRQDMGWRTSGVAPSRVPVPPPVPVTVDNVTSDEESDTEGSSVTEDSGDVEFDSQTVTVPVTICLTIMVGYICGGAVLFSSWEDWNFLDGSYFCFISLSTIGFGDFVPGDKLIDANQGFDLSFIFCSMYLMLGMALIAMCFNLMQEEVVHKMRSCMASLRNCLGCVKRSVLPSR